VTNSKEKWAEKSLAGQVRQHHDGATAHAATHARVHDASYRRVGTKSLSDQMHRQPQEVARS